MQTSSSSPANPYSANSGGDITGKMETDALIRASTSPLPATASNKKRRRRLGKRAATLACPPRRQQSFGSDIGHAAAETYLVTRLTFKLLSYLGIDVLKLMLARHHLGLTVLRSTLLIIFGVGYRWITRLLALALYAMFLMPGFLQVGFCYFFSSQVRRSIVYGDKPRNRLDLYLPSAAYGDDLKPVVIFVTGGAWIIGYKAWGSLLGLQLAERGIMVACIDYRNFPQGTISEMVDDVSQGIAFVLENIIEFGGDPTKIYLMGQSAGAHISACALVQQAVREFKNENISWSASHISAYFGLSGGYNLLKLVDHFHGRGLYRSIFLSIMEGEKALEQFSPEMIVRNLGSCGAVSQLPHIILFHGTYDYSIPCEASKKFVEALRNAGVQADLILYDGKTHTDLFLQDPLRGGKDDLFDYLVAFIHANDKEALAMDATAPPRKRLVPEILLRLAGRISPF